MLMLKIVDSERISSTTVVYYDTSTDVLSAVFMTLLRRVLYEFQFCFTFESCTTFDGATRTQLFLFCCLFVLNCIIFWSDL